MTIAYDRDALGEGFECSESKCLQEERWHQGIISMFELFLDGFERLSAVVENLVRIASGEVDDFIFVFTIAIDVYDERGSVGGLTEGAERGEESGSSFFGI